PRVDRLGQVAVAARLPRALVVALHRVRGQRDDGNVTRRGVGLQQLRCREAVGTGETQIDEDQLWLLHPGAFDAVFRVFRVDHVVAMRLEQRANQLQV